MIRFTHACRLALLAIFSLTPFASAHAAEAYPNGPIKIVVPAPPGGTADKLARILSTGVAAGLGLAGISSAAFGLVATAALVGAQYLMPKGSSAGSNLPDYSAPQSGPAPTPGPRRSTDRRSASRLR